LEFLSSTEKQNTFPTFSITLENEVTLPEFFRYGDIELLSYVWALLYSCVMFCIYERPKVYLNHFEGIYLSSFNLVRESKYETKDAQAPSMKSASASSTAAFDLSKSECRFRL